MRSSASNDFYQTSKLLLIMCALAHLPQFENWKSVISMSYVSNQAIFCTTFSVFSIIFGLLGICIFILWSSTFNSFGAVETTLSFIVLSFAGSSTSRDLTSRISSISFLGAVPSPEVFIHCCRVLRIARERKQTKIWACVLSCFWWYIGRIPRSCFSVLKASSTSVKGNSAG